MFFKIVDVDDKQDEFVAIRRLDWFFLKNSPQRVLARRIKTTLTKDIPCVDCYFRIRRRFPPTWYVDNFSFLFTFVIGIPSTQIIQWTIMLSVFSLRFDRQSWRSWVEKGWPSSMIISTSQILKHENAMVPYSFWVWTHHILIQITIPTSSVVSFPKIAQTFEGSWDTWKHVARVTWNVPCGFGWDEIRNGQTLQ